MGPTRLLWVSDAVGDQSAIFAAAVDFALHLLQAVFMNCHSPRSRGLAGVDVLRIGQSRGAEVPPLLRRVA